MINHTPSKTYGASSTIIMRWCKCLHLRYTVYSLMLQGLLEYDYFELALGWWKFSDANEYQDWTKSLIAEYRVFNNYAWTFVTASPLCLLPKSLRDILPSSPQGILSLNCKCSYCYQYQFLFGYALQVFIQWRFTIFEDLNI